MSVNLAEFLGLMSASFLSQTQGKEPAFEDLIVKACQILRETSPKFDKNNNKSDKIYKPAFTVHEFDDYYEYHVALPGFVRDDMFNTKLEANNTGVCFSGTHREHGTISLCIDMHKDVNLTSISASMFYELLKIRVQRNKYVHVPIELHIK